MNRQSTKTDYYASKYTDLPLSSYFGITNFDDLQQIADENNVTIDESIAFIRTIPIDIVQTYRQRLVEQPMFRDKWITLPVTLPSANGDVQTFRVLASIFENGIAGELSLSETGRSDEQFDSITSTEASIYDYVNVKTAANRTKVALKVKLILTGVVAFWIIAIVTVVLLISILSQTSNTTTTTAVLTTTTTTTTTKTIPNTMSDCYDWLHINGSNSSGIYLINPGYGLEPFDVYCDMTTDGGGWTVIQRSDMWNNTWQQYKNGFNNGLENGNLWLGNDRIHVMSQSNVTLRIEIYGDRYPITNPNIYLYGTYNFSISDEMNNYTLFISLPIEGNASDTDPNTGFIVNNGLPFSTIDKSSNEHGSSCANTLQLGGWWFGLEACIFLSLNGKYNPSYEYRGFIWYSPATGYIQPNRSEMKIRRQ